MQTSKAQLPCGSAISASSSNLALPITRYIISRCAQWKRGPKNSSHSIKSTENKNRKRRGNHCHWDGFLFVLKKIFLLNINSAWHGIQGKAGKSRRFLFCFLFIQFSKHPFYFHCALKRMQENWGCGIKRERRILELRSLANPFSVKICVRFCAVMKRWKEKDCPHIMHHEASQRDLWLEEQVHPTTGSFPSLPCCQITLSEGDSVPTAIVHDFWVRSRHRKSI